MYVCMYICIGRCTEFGFFWKTERNHTCAKKCDGVCHDTILLARSLALSRYKINSIPKEWIYDDDIHNSVKSRNDRMILVAERERWVSVLECWFMVGFGRCQSVGQVRFDGEEEELEFSNHLNRYGTCVYIMLCTIGFAVQIR